MPMPMGTPKAGPVQDNPLRLMGFSLPDFLSAFLSHRHSGTAMDGKPPEGPYYITSSGGKRYLLVVADDGTLSTTAA